MHVGLHVMYDLLCFAVGALDIQILFFGVLFKYFQTLLMHYDKCLFFFHLHRLISCFNDVISFCCFMIATTHSVYLRNSIFFCVFNKIMFYILYSL